MNTESEATPEDPREDEQGSDRRKFFQVCLGGMGVLTGGFTALPVVTFLGPPETLAAQGPVEVPLAELEAGQAIYREVQGTPVVIVPGEEGPTVFSASCTHLGCIVRWEHESNTFVCPCHGAYFDARGNPLKGPTNQPLPKIEHEVKDGKIILG